MKRLLKVLLTIAILCAFTACGDTDAPGKNGDWIYSFQSTNGTISNHGFYFVQKGGLLSFADIKTGGYTHLCTLAGCNHTNEETCSALVSSLTKSTMFFWDEHLYYIDSNRYGNYLYRRDATGAAMEEVGAFGTKYIEEQKSLQINEFAVADGYVYYAIGVYGSVYCEDIGGYDTRKVMDAVCRMDLKTGKEEIILEQSVSRPEEGIQLCAARKDEILFTYREGLDKDLKDADYSEALNQIPVSLKKWSSETGAITTILEKTLIDFESVQMVWDGKVYYKTRTAMNNVNPGYTYSYDLDTGREALVSKELLRHIGGGYADSYNRETQETRLFHIGKGEYLPFTLFQHGYSGGWLYAVSDTGCVIELSGELRKENVSDTTGYRTMYYCYVSYESLADGFQKEDMVILYTYEIHSGESAVS